MTRRAVPSTTRKPWHGPKDRWEWRGLNRRYSWPVKPKWTRGTLGDGHGFWMPKPWTMLPWNGKQYSGELSGITEAQRRNSLRRIPAPRKGGKK